MAIAQLNLGLKERPKWGGKRKNAGRKPKGLKAGLPHRPRPALASRHPVHVTLKLRPEIENLRTKKKVQLIRAAFRAAKLQGGFRLVHFTIQSNHLHLIVEAKATDALSKGVSALEIRIARGINRVLNRRGPVFLDRFHSRALKSPRETRHALAYVLLNSNRHAQRPSSTWDPCSSGAHFDGWRMRPKPPAAIGDEKDDDPVAEPKTWFLQVGWRRHGLLEPGEVPSSAR